MVNDPWPTAFASGGFDLSAVGVVNSSQNNIDNNNFSDNITIWPNPVSAGGIINVNTSNNAGISNINFKIIDLQGNTVINKNVNHTVISIPQNIKAGLYFIFITNSEGKIFTSKLVIK